MYTFRFSDFHMCRSAFSIKYGLNRMKSYKALLEDIRISWIFVRRRATCWSKKISLILNIFTCVFIHYQSSWREMEWLDNLEIVQAAWAALIANWNPWETNRRSQLFQIAECVLSKSSYDGYIVHVGVNICIITLPNVCRKWAILGAMPHVCISMLLLSSY